MQRVFTTYRANVESLPLGEMNLGFLKPGRYNGFRTLEAVSGLNLAIGHISSQSINKPIEGNYSPFGAIVTANGSIVHESEPIEVLIDTNFGNLNVRYDLLICEHEYVTVVGGQPAVYLVIKGDNLGNTPVVPNPIKQVIVGTFKLEPNAYSIGSGITFQPKVSPLLGDMTEAELLAKIAMSSTTTNGVIKLATLTESDEGMENSKAMTPLTAKAQRGKRVIKTINLENPVVGPGDTVPTINLPLAGAGSPMVNDGKVIILTKTNETSSIKLLLVKPILGQTLSYTLINKRTNTTASGKLGINIDLTIDGALFIPENCTSVVKQNGRINVQFDALGNVFISGDLVTIPVETEPEPEEEPPFGGTTP